MPIEATPSPITVRRILITIRARVAWRAPIYRERERENVRVLTTMFLYTGDTVSFWFCPEIQPAVDAERNHSLRSLAYKLRSVVFLI